MNIFVNSATRGWRWLTTFFGILLVVCGSYVFWSWPSYGWNRDAVILAFPTWLVLLGLLLLHLGLIARDETLLKMIDMFRALSRYL